MKWGGHAVVLCIAKIWMRPNHSQWHRILQTYHWVESTRCYTKWSPLCHSCCEKRKLSKIAIPARTHTFWTFPVLILPISQSHQIVKLSSHQWDESKSPPLSGRTERSHLGQVYLLDQFGSRHVCFTKGIALPSSFHCWCSFVWRWHYSLFLRIWNTKICSAELCCGDQDSTHLAMGLRVERVPGWSTEWNWD